MLCLNLATPGKDLAHWKRFSEKLSLVFSWVGSIYGNEISFGALPTAIAVTGEKNKQPVISFVPMPINELLKFALQHFFIRVEYTTHAESGGFESDLDLFCLIYNAGQLWPACLVVCHPDDKGVTALIQPYLPACRILDGYNLYALGLGMADPEYNDQRSN